MVLGTSRDGSGFKTFSPRKAEGLKNLMHTAKNAARGPRYWHYQFEKYIACVAVAEPRRGELPGKQFNKNVP